MGSTCYTAGGMPVAFTQEDFLVTFNFLHFDFKFNFVLERECGKINKMPL